LLGLILLVRSPHAQATEVGLQRNIGIGLVAGSAPGLTAKIWTRPTAALDLGLGIGLGSVACSEHFNPCGRRTSFNADYLWQSGHNAADGFGVHVGLGARVWFWDYGNGRTSFEIAPRVPMGIDLYLFKWLEVYAEVAPSLLFNPTYLFLEGAIGARIYL
jgi:hypothetical protein